jgi:hypothetical protein
MRQRTAAGDDPTVRLKQEVYTDLPAVFVLLCLFISALKRNKKIAFVLFRKKYM